MVLVNAQISDEDREFCKKQHLSITTLLRSSILRHKEILSGEIIQNVDTERDAKEKFKEKFQKTLKKLAQSIPKEDFDKFLESEI